MASKSTIIVIGNDGTGKTSIVKYLRECGYSAWERSVFDIEAYPKHLVSPKEIDKLTLSLPLDVIDSESFSNLEKRMFQDKVYWFLLDLDVETIQNRISKRDILDPIYETSNSLSYYRKRFLQFAYSMGIPVISNVGSLEDTVSHMLDFIRTPGKYQTIHNFMLHGKTKADLERYINYIPPSYEGDFLYPILSSVFGEISPEISKSCSDDIGIYKLIEGESKQVFCIWDRWGYFHNKVIIFLKPTIYSHSKQSTGEITGLEKIRAKATNYFLEIMWRNGLNHSYYCVNNNGVILSERINDVPLIEVVVKRYCAGTDKYSYYGMNNMENFCYHKESGSTDARYTGGPYVRFDWRNPNHIVTYDNSMRNPVESPWYYIYESKVGKERFFTEFLQKYCKPLGDKCIPEHLAKREINTETAKRSVLRMFYSISYYLHKMNLEIQDVCFMVDKTGSLFWSEINQDCMRIKPINPELTGYDKDLWRVGGSDAKQNILDKWGEFNPLLASCLTESTFLSEECYKTYPYYREIRDEITKIDADDEYKSLYRSLLPIAPRRVMVTCDIYDGKPALVKSGTVVEYHSDENVDKALQYISIFPDILTVDLNAALSEGNNRELIKNNATKYYTHCGGGIRSIHDVQDILSTSARRIVISTNLSEEFIRQIPKDRLIVELSVNEKNEIMTHGRKGIYGSSLVSTAEYLYNNGVQSISVTFHKTEGHLKGLDKSQVQRVYDILSVHKFDKIYIAGGISSIEDMEFIWSLGEKSQKVIAIPQLGSAIWKGKLSIGEIYCAMLSATDESEIPAIIQSNDGKVKGLIYLNREAIINTCKDRLLWRYSRRHDRVMLKGESSGNVQKVIKMSVDCDADSLLITVDTTHPFCHTGNTSCFSLQTSIKGNLVDLMQHIAKSSQSPSSYSNRMTKYPGLALMKTMEEFWEVVTSEHISNNGEKLDLLAKHKLRECCDFLAHFLMYLTSRNVNIEDIFNELNARRWNPRLIRPIPQDQSDVYVIGITGNKYSKKTDDFIKDILGIRLIRPNGRDMKIDYEVVDFDKVKEAGIPSDRLLSFVGVRPKDMPTLLTTGKINAAVTYNTVMENFPTVSKLVTSIPDYDLRLALIHRNDEEININQEGKILIAAEHPIHVETHLYKKFGLTDKFSLDRVIGSSETFLVNTTSKKYSLCDALVDSGLTLKENGLEIWDTILDRGQVRIGLYAALD